jgi:putative transcriptional regulator
VENRVEELRKALGLNQEDFARAIRVSRQTVSSIENGKYNPSLELAFVISDFFGKSIEEIFLHKTLNRTELQEEKETEGGEL